MHPTSSLSRVARCTCGALRTEHWTDSPLDTSMPVSCSVHCVTCGAEMEMDGDTLPPSVREAILAEDTWMLVVTRDLRARALAALRVELGLPFAELHTRVRSDQPLASGTFGEMTRLERSLRKRLGEGGEVRRVEQEDHDQAPARENNRRMAAAYADAAEARRAREAEDHRLDEAAFTELLRVVRGEISPPLDPLSAKTLRVLLSPDSDTTITQQAFHTHLGKTRPRPHSYFRRAAPPLVAALMRATRVARLDGALVVALPAATIEAEGYPAISSHSSRWVSFEPGADRLVLRVRDPAVLPRPQHIEELLPPAVPPRIERVLDGPRSCPRCGHVSSRFREVEGALQCAACGRTWGEAELGMG